MMQNMLAMKTNLFKLNPSLLKLQQSSLTQMPVRSFYYPDGNHHHMQQEVFSNTF